jgi:2-oxoglutarate dehydrogenase E2 component (dihydrolipoamide succinyltransferase)
VLVEVKVPVLAESVTEATLLDWHKQVGDHVKRGDNLIDLETDKVTLEVTAPEDGVVKQIVKPSGETAGSNEVLAIIDTEAPNPSSSQAPEPQKKEVDTEIPRSSSPKAPEPQKKEAANEEIKLSPAARKLVAEHGIEPATLPASGKQGRLTKGDVLAYLSNPTTLPEQGPKTLSPEPPAPPPSAPSERPERRIAMTRLRRRAAERLLAAQQENAILTTFNEVNMQAVIALRDRYRQTFEKQHDIKLGFMSFFVRATVEALKRFPIINASVDGDDIVYHDYYDLGIAVASARGLVVPVIRDADRLSFAEIEQRIQKLVEKARDSSLTLEDLTGGTFTITNGGIFGSLLSTPILNPPQSAILGMHRVQDRPVAENNQVVIRPMMYLALSYDHRIIDGREAISFLVAIKEQLEDPGRMLLQI